MKEQGFPKAERLLKRAEFLALGRNAAKIHNPHFLMLYKPGAAARSRLGITVTRKVGGAVHRNAIKRQVREYFRLHCRRMSGCWDMNIIAKQQASGPAAAVLQDSLRQLFALLAESTRH